MTEWSKCDFDYAATQLDFLLRKHNVGNVWMLENDCLVATRTTHSDILCKSMSTQVIPTIEPEKDQHYSAVSSFDNDVLIVRNTITTYDWFLTISYSHIWHVPILHFSIQMQDGTPLSRQEVIDRCLLTHSADLQVDALSDFVSIDEHPVTGLPSYFLHPCHTSRRLEILRASTTNSSLRLWSWMSMILPIVGVTICPLTFSLIQQELNVEE